MIDLPNRDPNTLLTPPEVAEYLQVSARTVQRYVNAGMFPNHRTVRSGFLIPWGDVLNFLQNKNK